jgi:antitoxin component of MazEF toxin-antitoxin module
MSSGYNLLLSQVNVGTVPTAILKQIRSKEGQSVDIFVSNKSLEGIDVGQ